MIPQPRVQLPSGTTSVPAGRTVYTIGYRAPGAMEKIQELVNAGAVLIDIRLHPASRFSPQWNRNRLKARFGWQNYEHLRNLGNVNYQHKELPWQLRDAAVGIMWLCAVLTQRDVVLMCGCPDPDHCHRSLVCAKLREECPELRIVHLVARPIVTVEWKEVPMRAEVTP